MKISHLCVNYGTPLFQEFFHALNTPEIDQTVFYPRNKGHQIIQSKQPYRVDSPLLFTRLTKISFRRKRRIMEKHYDPLFHITRPDIIHAHTLFSDGSLANYCNRKYGIPFVVAIRSTDMDVFLRSKPWLMQYSKQILNNANYIIFISHSLKKKFQLKYGDSYETKSLVIPNGINQSFFAIENIQKKALHPPTDLLYVGNFLKRKNVPSLIKFVKTSHARLTLVGEGGNNEKKVLKMINNTSRVNHLGRIDDQSKLSEIYRASDIFIMISKNETFGLVYLEAMSQGLPVIYAKGTGIDGLFKEGEVGFGVNPNSFNDIDNAIQGIISDYANISKNCIRAAKEFNWSNISNRYYQVYTKSLL